MCWLLKPLLAGSSHTLRADAIKFRTRFAGRKSQPYLLINHSGVNLHISGTMQVEPSLLNMGNGLSEGIVVPESKADGCVCVERRLVRVHYRQIATQIMTCSTEPHPLNYLERASAWTKSLWAENKTKRWWETTAQRTWRNIINRLSIARNPFKLPFPQDTSVQQLSDQSH